MAQVMFSKRKKWKPSEIERIKQLRCEGYKLKEIAKIFQVTANAVRKTLVRHIPMYVKINNQKSKEHLCLWSTIDQLINFGILNNLVYEDQNGFFYVNNQMYNRFQCIEYINNYRSKNNMHKILLFV